jgi:hypothetical protein
MSFAEEFKKIKSAGMRMEAEAEKAPETAPAPEPTAEPAADDPDKALYDSAYGDAAKTFKDVAAPEADKATPEPPKAPPITPDGRKVKIKIGGKEFDSEQAAIDYANELELVRLQEESYKQGIEAAKPKEPAPVKVSELKNISEKLFENPEEALEALQTLIDKRTEEKLSASKQAELDARARELETKKLWDNFYKSNSDLVGFDEEVNQILQKEWNKLQHMKADAAMGELASYTRNYINSLREKVLPKQVLSSKPAMTAPTSSSTTATSKPATKQRDDFISQIRKHGKRNVVQDEA